VTATRFAHTRRRRRRSRLDRLRARIDAAAFILVLAAATGVIVYLNRDHPEEPQSTPSVGLRRASVAQWGDCGIVKAACNAHETPFTVVGVGANKCELRFVCSNTTGEPFAAGMCTTVAESC